MNKSISEEEYEKLSKSCINIFIGTCQKFRNNNLNDVKSYR